MLTISLTTACSRYTYNGVIIHAHPVRGESHIQRNTTREVATPYFPTFSADPEHKESLRPAFLISLH